MVSLNCGDNIYTICYVFIRERHRKSGEDPKPLSYDDGDFMDSPRSYPVHV